MSWQGKDKHSVNVKIMFNGYICGVIISVICLLDSLQKDYKKQMLMAAHALAVDAKNLLDVIDQSRLKMINQTRPH